MPHINWLHITDLHFTSGGASAMASQKWLWPNVRESFEKDLRRLYQRSGPWDFVIFTGDLVQSGTAEDYNGLEQVLSALWGVFESLGCNPKLLAIPGNHDVKWPDQLEPTVIAFRHGWASDQHLRDKFWSSSPNPFRTLIEEVFRPYSAWRSACAFHAVIERGGILPGDFSATLEKDGAKIGVIGLNSTFLQLGPGFKEGDLCLDARQLASICDGDPVNWCAKNQLNILLTHHPKAWLSEAARSQFDNELAPAGRFGLHLFGHMHEPAAVVTQHGGSKPRREMQGASLFGLESWQGPNGETHKRIHGYAAFRFSINGDSANIACWPRIATLVDGGGWTMSPNHKLSLNEDERVDFPFR